jgi:hypothetical protein
LKYVLCLSRSDLKAIASLEICIHENGRACRTSDVYTGKRHAEAKKTVDKFRKQQERNKSHALGRNNLSAKMQRACEYM